MPFVEVPTAPPPPGAAAPQGTRMASSAEIQRPNEIVAAPAVDAQPAGTMVVAPVAPLSGPIPEGQTAVVVSVKRWWQSSEIIVSLLVIVGAGVDSAVSGLMPMLSAGEIDMKALEAAALRSFLAGCFAAFIAYRRKASNAVVR